MLILPYVLICIYLLYFRKKNKNAWLIVALTIIFLSITSKTYADLPNYQPLFDYYNLNNVNITISTTNFLWAYLCKFFGFLGFNYRGMVVILIFINYYIIHLGLKNFMADENKFFGLFMIFPAIIQLIQLKFFTAFSIVFLAYSLYIKNGKYSSIKFILLTIFASLIHSSASVFLILIFCNNKKLNNNLLLIITIFFSILFNCNLSIITGLAKKYLSERHFNRYFVNSITPSSIIWILAIFSLWLVCLLILKLIISKVDKKENSKCYEILEKNDKSITLFLLTIPLLFIDRNMHRFLEMGFCILMLSISLCIRRDNMTKNNVMFLFCISLVLIIAMFIYTPYSSVLQPVFSYDGFISIFK